MHVNLAVKQAPPVVFKNTESGDTFIGQEQPHTIIARFVGGLLQDYRYLDDYSAPPVSRPTFSCIPRLTMILQGNSVVPGRPQFRHALVDCGPDLPPQGMALRAPGLIKQD